MRRGTTEIQFPTSSFRGASLPSLLVPHAQQWHERRGGLLKSFFHFLSLTYQSYLLVYLCSFTCTYALVNFNALYRFNSTSSSTCVYSSSPHLPFIFPPSLSSPHSLDLMRLTHHILLLSVYAPLSSRHFLTCKKRKNTINLYNHFQEKATDKN